MPIIKLCESGVFGAQRSLNKYIYTIRMHQYCVTQSEIIHAWCAAAARPTDCLQWMRGSAHTIAACSPCILLLVGQDTQRSVCSRTAHVMRIEMLESCCCCLFFFRDFVVNSLVRTVFFIYSLLMLLLLLLLLLVGITLYNVSCAQRR